MAALLALSWEDGATYARGKDNFGRKRQPHSRDDNPLLGLMITVLKFLAIDLGAYFSVDLKSPRCFIQNKTKNCL